jgi:hypothetical protein
LAGATFANSSTGRPSSGAFKSSASDFVRALSRQKSDLTVNNIPVNFGGDAFYPGIDVKGIRIVGNRATANVQNAFVFYDRADQIFV